MSLKKNDVKKIFIKRKNKLMKNVKSNNDQLYKNITIIYLHVCYHNKYIIPSENVP